jgi:hypothetical protein
VEDLVNMLSNRYYFNKGTPYTDEDPIAPEDGVPYASEEEVLSMIPESHRFAYLTVNISRVEYWFNDALTLVPKVNDLAIEDGSILLKKLIAVASGTVLYRKSVGEGPIEAQTLATLKEDLGIPGPYTIPEGYSLIPTEDLSKLHEKGSDNQT